MPDLPRPFASLRFPLAVDSALGRVAVETDYVQHVEQLMRQVLLTAPQGLVYQFPRDMAKLGRLIGGLAGRGRPPTREGAG